MYESGQLAKLVKTSMDFLKFNNMAFLWNHVFYNKKKKNRWKKNQAQKIKTKWEKKDTLTNQFWLCSFISLTKTKLKKQRVD
jgi:hypothetical protein